MKYMLYSTCKIVKGHTKSIICDLQNGTFENIPNSLSGFFHASNNNVIDINQIKACLTSENWHVFEEYLSFLINNKYIFEIDDDEIQCFPLLSEDFYDVSLVSNFIVDVEYFEINWAHLVNQLESLLCFNVEIRFYREVSIKELDHILNFFRNSLVQTIYLTLPFKNIAINELIQLVDINARIINLILSGADKDEKLYESEHSSRGFIYKVKESLLSESQCGVVCPHQFAINIKHFNESKQFNSCLNKKMSIDSKGFVKNCPSSLESYGSFNENLELKDVLLIEKFKSKWNIHKDMIDKCNICEYRYICTDCRVYIEDPENIYSAPSKCNYEPKTGVWK